MLQPVNSLITSPEIKKWQGIFPAALTMFDAEGRLDTDATVRHARYLVDSGAAGLVLAGTTGEFIGLTPAERETLTREVAGALEGATPLIVGTGSYSTRETIEVTAASMAAGADAALVILPFYQRPHRSEVMEHFRAVSRATDAPLFVYNNPTNSGTDPLTGDDLAELQAEGHAVGVKSTFPTVHQVYESVVATTPDFRTFYGGFTAPIEGLAGGACGWISGILNVTLPDAVRMFDAVQAGDLPAAREIWATRILPIRFLYTKGLLGPLNDLELYRSILRLRGEHGGHSRAPLLPLSETQNSRLQELLAEQDLL